MLRAYDCPYLFTYGYINQKAGLSRAEKRERVLIMRRAILSFVASVVILAVYLYLFRNNQLMSGMYLGNSNEVVRFINTDYVEVLKSFEILAANVIAALCGLSFGRLVDKSLEGKHIS